MAELLNSETFGDKIYDRFPELYKREDKLLKTKDEMV